MTYLISGITVFLGLLLGSFLNVVIYRLPKTSIAGLREKTPYTLSYLAWPLSFCPHCKASIPPWLNIPIVSYLLLRGKSHCCQKKISFQYPFVEFCGGLIVLVSVMVGNDWLQVIFILIFLSFLLVLSVIDWQRFYLLDIITFPLLWVGLLANLNAYFVLLEEAVLGVVIGYLSLWVLGSVFSLIIKKRALGLGDAKLFAALGAWLGWQALPMTLFLAAVVGLVLGQSRLLFRGRARYIPFGPCLSLSGIIMMFYGERLMVAYWNFIYQ